MIGKYHIPAFYSQYNIKKHIMLKERHFSALWQMLAHLEFDGSKKVGTGKQKG